MDRAEYNACMGPYIRGKDKTKEERRTGFCIGAKLCSGKTKSREEALRICSQPKPPKVPKEGGQRRSRGSECPEFDPTTLIPYCEKKLMIVVKSGELPLTTDVTGICQLILG
jgi:hypothetical protein